MPALEYLESLWELFHHQIELFDYMANAGLSILFDSIELLCCLSLEHQHPNEQIPTMQNDATDTLRVVFAVGGTGGHIYPTVAIADELKITNPNVQIHDSISNRTLKISFKNPKLLVC